jgi:hypothetical protein
LGDGFVGTANAALARRKASHTVASIPERPETSITEGAEHTRQARASRTLLPTMSVPIPLPEPARGDEAVPAQRSRGGAVAVAWSLAVAAGTVLLGVVGGFCWAAAAPRALLVMTSPGAASVINPETNAFIAADAAFCLVCLGGGVLSGVLGYLFAVRRNGPLGMVALLGGAVAAAFVARWVGEQSGLATFRHLLATLPAGARLRDTVTLGASGALGFWPLATCVVAGGLVLLARPGRHRARRHARPS